VSHAAHEPVVWLLMIAQPPSAIFQWKRSRRSAKSGTCQRDSRPANFCSVRLFSVPCSAERPPLLLRSAGIYMVEDTLTSYWPDFAGGYRKPGTFLEYRCARWHSVRNKTMNAECS